MAECQSRIRVHGRECLPVHGRRLIQHLGDHGALPWHGERLRRDAACTPRWRPYSSLEGATAAFYASTDDYERYDGVDLTSGHTPWPNDAERRQVSTSDFRRLVRKQRALRVGECEAKVENGTWHTHLVGPFESEGGYDWWQLSWLLRNLTGRSGALVQAHWTGPVHALGPDEWAALEYPPIHLHHVHIVPGDTDTFAQRLDGWTHQRVLEHHGDWDLSHLGLGLNGLGQDYRPRGKFVTGAISFNLELNDVRPKNSSRLTWFYQISVLLADQATAQTPVSIGGLLSVHKTHNPRMEGHTCGQNCAVLPFFAPTNVDSFVYYEGVMPFGGELVGVVYHAHQSGHQETLLFSGAAAGLSLPRFDRSAPLLPSAANATSNAQLRARLLRAHADRLVCSAQGQQARIDGIIYDRAAFPTCFEWKFHAQET